MKGKQETTITHQHLWKQYQFTNTPQESKQEAEKESTLIARKRRSEAAIEQNYLKKPPSKDENVKYHHVHLHRSMSIIFPTLEPTVEEKARANIANLKRRTQEPGIFDDFESQVSMLFAESSAHDGTQSKPFMHTFVEYVILEVMVQNIFALVPAKNAKQRCEERFILWTLRSDCRRRWGATLKYHAKLFREVINYSLVQRGKLGAIPYFWKRGRHFKRLQFPIHVDFSFNFIIG